MLKRLLTLFLILTLLVPVAVAQGPFGGGGLSGGGGGCDHYYHANTVQLASVISAGDIELWATHSACGVSESTTSIHSWTFRLSAPPILSLGGLSLVITPTLTGCTANTPTVLTDAGAAATGATGYFDITMTSNNCHGRVLVDFNALNALMLSVFRLRVVVPVSIQHGDNANYNFLCAATGTSANAQDPDLATCNTPTINASLSGTVGLTGTLTLNGIPDTQQEIQAIADALAAGLDVQICPETEPCYHVLSGSIDSNTTTTIGNATFPSQVQITFPGDSENPGLDFWFLFWFWVAVLLFFLYHGWIFAAGFAVPGLLDAMFPTQIPWDFQTYLVLCLFGFLLEVAANRFQWGGYQSGRRRLRIGE